MLDIARDPGRPDAGDVRLCARRRLVCSHPRAEAHRPPDPARRALHRPAAALGRRRQIVTQTPTAKKSVQLSGVVVAESAVSLDRSRRRRADVPRLRHRGHRRALDLRGHGAISCCTASCPTTPARAAFRRELSDRRCPRRRRSAIDAVGGEATPMDMLRTAASMLSFGIRGAGRDRPRGGARAGDAPDREAADGDRAPPPPPARARAGRAGPALGYSENFLAMLSRRAARRRAPPASSTSR